MASVACWAALLSCAAAIADPPPQPKPLRAQLDQDVSFELRGHTIATYRATESPMKPFLRELWTPGGVQILRDSPHDHKHHHGIMFAFDADGNNFWCDEPFNGRQVPKPLENLQLGGTPGTSRVGFTQPLDWVASSGTLTLTERRTITAFADPKIDATLLTWRHLPQCAGAQAGEDLWRRFLRPRHRFAVSMDGKGRFFNAAGQEGTRSGPPAVPDGAAIGNSRVSQAKWSAYTATADNTLVTIALFHHPKNPSPPYVLQIHPTFAFLAASLNLDRKPMEIKPGTPLDLRFGIALWDGAVNKGRVEAMYQKWVELEP